MKKEYILFNNKKYNITLSFEDEEFDYYSDVSVILFFEDKSMLLFKDNLLSLKNIFDDYDIKTLDGRLNESKLGLFLNDYYRGTYEGKYEKYLILDKHRHWIGENYYWLQSIEYTTWLYQYEDYIALKVTPMFTGFEEDDFTDAYHKFAKSYKNVFCQKVSLNEIVRAERKIFDLYEIYFG